MSTAVNVAVVGYGYWGPNVVRNFLSLPPDKAKIRTVCDARKDRLEIAARLYPGVKALTSLEETLADPDVDLVAVATPVSSHYEIAMKALDAGKHVLVEKPLTGNLKDAADLVARANDLGKHLFVDHTFVFTPAVQKMKALLKTGELGTPLYYDSMRINLGIFQHDVDVIWDLIPHDLSILEYLFDGLMPQSISCGGAAHYGELADIAYVTLYYPNNFIAHVNVNWLAPVKIRQVLLCGDKKMVVYDEHTVQEKVRVYDRGVEVARPEDVYNKLVQYRDGDMFAPRLDNTEALKAEVVNIVNTIQGTEKAIAPGEAGMRVVQLLEAATLSLKEHGRPVPVSDLVGMPG